MRPYQVSCTVPTWVGLLAGKKALVRVPRKAIFVAHGKVTPPAVRLHPAASTNSPPGYHAESVGLAFVVDQMWAQAQAGSAKWSSVHCGARGLNEASAGQWTPDIFKYLESKWQVQPLGGLFDWASASGFKFKELLTGLLKQNPAIERMLHCFKGDFTRSSVHGAG